MGRAPACSTVKLTLAETESRGWFETASTVAAALDLVSQECDGQCTCSPSDFDCESPCMLKGETHSCRHRVQWSVGEGSTVIDALNSVSQECSGQCVCSAADFGVEENVSTTTMPTTSEADADQTISTTSMQGNTSEPEQGDRATTSEPVPPADGDEGHLRGQE